MAPPPSLTVYLKSLNLQAFRNYTAQTVHLTAPKTILVGNNAQGKSNLLESVALLSTLKSQRASSDRELVQNEAAMGQIRGDLERITGEIELEIRLRRFGPTHGVS